MTSNILIKISPNRLTAIRAIEAGGKVSLQARVAFGSWETVRVVSREKFEEDGVAGMGYEELREYAFKIKREKV